MAERSQRWAEDYVRVQAALRGEQAAWDTLYRDAYPPALYMARRVGALGPLGEEEIQDVVAEAFRRCLVRLDCFRPVSRFSTWVCGFVRYVALESVRGAYSRRERLRQWSGAEAPADGTDPEQWLLRRERDGFLRLAFRSLSPRHQVLIGCFVLGWSTRRQVRAQTGLRQPEEMQQALEEALRTLRRRFLELY